MSFQDEMNDAQNRKARVVPKADSRESAANQNHKVFLRNQGRLKEAEEFTNLCAKACESVYSLFSGVNGAVIGIESVPFEVDGLDPDTGDVFLLKIVDAKRVSIIFLGKTVQIMPYCTTRHGSKVRAHWAVQLMIDGVLQGIEWEFRRTVYGDGWELRGNSLYFDGVTFRARNQKINWSSVTDESSLQQMFRELFISPTE